MGTKLLWLDMEMTGLDVEKEVPIEIAAIITDWKFRALAEYHTVIRQPQAYLDRMDEWNQKQHRQSGLYELIPKGKDPAAVDHELSALIAKEFGSERAILCGNSIGQDRLFIRKHLPKVEATLHYRMLDVTSFKIVFNGLYDLKFKKKDGHRALDDIRESMAELQFYLSHVKA
ncbi:MAG: oligoribonuclease [Bdellovibrionales bacterium]